MNDGTNKKESEKILVFGENLVSSQDNKLIIRDKHTKSIKLEKEINKGEIKQIEISPSNNGLLIRFGHPKNHSFSEELEKTLGLFDENGKNIWWAEQTEEYHDKYSEIEVRRDKIFGHLISGYSCQLDPKTGKIISKEFVK